MTDHSENLTPGRAIRKFCIDCVGGFDKVRACGGDSLQDGPCIFLPHRIGRGRPKVRTIRKMCLYCMGGRQPLVKDCSSKGCFLNPYRMGRNPNFPRRVGLYGGLRARIDQTTPGKGSGKGN